MTNGIDVSKHNGVINWQKVKASGKVDFAILRAGLGKLASQKDTQFEANYKGCTANGIPCGAYWYSYAMSEAEARQEADAFLAVIKGKQFDMPVYYDVEEQKQFALGREKISAIIRAFLERVESAGYYVGLYGSSSSLKTYTAEDIKSRYTIWLAHWVNQTNYTGYYHMWQYGIGKGIPGISGDVDVNHCYQDFPAIIRANGLNGFPKQEKPTAQETAPETAPETAQPTAPQLPYIPSMTAADVQTYLAWCAAKGAGKYPDSAEGFAGFLNEN